MSDNTYNGWTNRETWLINVWFDPENVSDIDNAKETIENDYDSLPDYLKDFIDIQSINWQELKEHFSEESNDPEGDD